MIVPFAEVSQLESLLSGEVAEVGEVGESRDNSDAGCVLREYGPDPGCVLREYGPDPGCVLREYGPEPGCVLREYGPEFNVCALPDALGGAVIDLDEHYLPHIDPRLTVRSPPAPAWEPLITKVYSAYDDDLSRLSIINTDIY